VSEVKTMPIRELRREVEANFTRAVKACRIEPTLIHQLQPIITRLRILEALESVGVEEVAFDRPHIADYVNPPLPEEVVEFYRTMKSLSIDVGGTYMHEDIAYIRIVGFGRDLYAIIRCSPPTDPLGEPDMLYNGVKIYSVERFRQYIEWWKKYIRDVLAGTYIRVDVNQYLDSLEKIMPKGDELGYMWLPYNVKREYFEGFEIILDEELRSAVKVVKPLYTYAHWVVERPSMSLVKIIRNADEILARYIKSDDRRDRFKAIIGSSGRMVELPFEKAREILELSEDADPELLEKVRRFYEEYCEGLYLVNESYCSSVSPSIYHPLRLLYLSHLARRSGLDGAIIRHGKEFYVRIVRNIYCRIGYWSLVVKPRKDLRVDYPHEAKFEDGYLLIIYDDMFKA